MKALVLLVACLAQAAAAVAEGGYRLDVFTLLDDSRLISDEAWDALIAFFDKLAVPSAAFGIPEGVRMGLMTYDKYPVVVNNLNSAPCVRSYQALLKLMSWRHSYVGKWEPFNFLGPALDTLCVSPAWGSGSTRRRGRVPGYPNVSPGNQVSPTFVQGESLPPQAEADDQSSRTQVSPSPRSPIQRLLGFDECMNIRPSSRDGAGAATDAASWQPSQPPSSPKGLRPVTAVQAAWSLNIALDAEAPATHVKRGSRPDELKTAAPPVWNFHPSIDTLWINMNLFNRPQAPDVIIIGAGRLPQDAYFARIKSSLWQKKGATVIVLGVEQTHQLWTDIYSPPRCPGASPTTNFIAMPDSSDPDRLRGSFDALLAAFDCVTYEAPTTAGPTSGTLPPASTAESSAAPSTAAPALTTEAPTTRKPIATSKAAPSSAEPTTEATTTTAKPTTEATTTTAMPTTEATTTTAKPTTEATTTTAKPTTEATTTTAKPTTKAPTTAAVTTPAPTTEAPTTETSTAKAPTSTTKLPTTSEALQTTTVKLTTKAPTTTAAPTTEARASTEAPSTEAPTTKFPTTEAPTTTAPTTKVTTTKGTTTAAPLTAAPTTQVPTTRAHRRSCRSSPCQHGGTCVPNSLIGYRCLCARCWEGPDCQLRVEGCRVVTTQAPTSRRTRPTRPSRPSRLPSKPTRAPGICQRRPGICGHGRCLQGRRPGSFRCVCQRGWTGRGCRVPVSSPRPWTRPTRPSKRTTSFPRTRPTWAPGPVCKTLPSVCVHGRCVQGRRYDAFRCICEPGWTGRNCALPVAPVTKPAPTLPTDICRLLKPCGDHGFCFIGGPQGFQCLCFKCWGGPWCQQSVCSSTTTTAKPTTTAVVTAEPTATPPDFCQRPGACSGHGLCLGNRQSHLCFCNGCWRGPECGVLSEACLSSTTTAEIETTTAQIETTTTAQIETTTVQIPTTSDPNGRDYCEKRGNPCLNGGSCQSIDNHDFTCECTQCWDGRVCEVPYAGTGCPDVSSTTMAAPTSAAAPTHLPPSNYRNCDELARDGQLSSSGVAVVTVRGQTFRVFCELRDGRGWTLFQRNTDGSLDFDRSWEEYKTGFGSLEGDFWLGLERIHLLTLGETSLRVDVSNDCTGDLNTAWQEYDLFAVDAESNDYSARFGGATRGPLGDSASFRASQQGARFSTRDANHDACPTKIPCNSLHSGGWWFSTCGGANLNGVMGSCAASPRNSFWEDWALASHLRPTASTMGLAPLYKTAPIQREF